MFTAAADIDTTSNARSSSDKTDAIVTRYLAGESQVAIAKALGMGHETVRRTLKERGVPLRPPRPVSGPHWQAILALHADGQTIKEISTELGLNFVTVYRVLRQAGRVQKKRR